jgi:hypothetical protein
MLAPSIKPQEMRRPGAGKEKCRAAITGLVFAHAVPVHRELWGKGYSPGLCARRTIKLRNAMQQKAATLGDDGPKSPPPLFCPERGQSVWSGMNNPPDNFEKANQAALSNS